MEKNSEEEKVIKDSDRPNKDRREYLKTIGIFAGGLAIGGVIGWLSKPTVTTQTISPVYLEYWDWQGPPGAIFGKEWPEAFRAHYPHIFVERRSLMYAEYNEALKSAIASGTAPDIAHVHPGAVQTDFAKSGQLVELGPIIDNDPEWKENLDILYGPSPGAPDWPVLVPSNPNDPIHGKRFCLPVDLNNLQMYYRKSILDKYDLKPPETVDDLIAMVPVLKKDGIYPLVLGWKDRWSAADLFTTLVWQLDKTDTLIANAEAGEASWKDPVFVEALNTILKMYDAGVFPNPNELGYFTEAYGMFKEGKAAFAYPHGNWLYATYKADGIYDDLDMIPLVKVNKDARSIVTGGVAIAEAILTGTKHMKEALMYLKWTTSEEAQKINVVKRGATPTSSKVLEEMWDTLDPLKKKDAEAQRRGTKNRYIYTLPTYDAVINAVQQVILKNKTPEELMGEVDEVHKKFLGKG
jgi:ABC-type glycerol-3-phosphate transport system substrate-binding protein